MAASLCTDMMAVPMLVPFLFPLGIPKILADLQNNMLSHPLGNAVDGGPKQKSPKPHV